MAKYLDMDGLSYLWTQFKTLLGNKVDKIDGKGLSTNDYTTTEKTKLSGIATNATSNSASSTVPLANGTAAIGSESAYARGDHIHPLQTTVSGNAGTATKLATARTIALSGGVTGTATSFNGSANITIPVTSVDASKLTGTIDIARIPQGALERLVVVTDDTARLALTTSSVQKGDTVKVTATGLMYFVVDDTKLTSEDGYEQYTAGTASSVAWSGITGKPSTFTPSTHTHTKSQITDMPTSLKNPNSLSLVVNGTTTSYDGSSAKSVTINESTLGITAITNAEIDTILAQ